MASIISGSDGSGPPVDGFSGPPKPLLRSILESHTVRDVVSQQLSTDSPGALVKAYVHEDVLSVCERLSAAHVSSVPVFSISGDKESIEGIVDFSDLVAYLLKMDWESLGSLKNGSQIWEELGSIPIGDAMDLSDRNPVVKIASHLDLLSAMAVLQENRLRRALVMENKDGEKVVAVLSPSAVIQFALRELKGRNDVILQRSIEELDVGFSPVESVKKSATVLEALHLMHVKRHSVVAVVDPVTGALAGSISMSDVKAVFQARRFSMLLKTCWTYIVEEREKSDTEVFPFFGVYPKDSLQMVVSKLLATNVHHLYVVNEQQQPQRVISFTDVCATLVRECPAE